MNHFVSNLAAVKQGMFSEENNEAAFVAKVYGHELVIKPKGETSFEFWHAAIQFYKALGYTNDVTVQVFRSDNSEEHVAIREDGYEYVNNERVGQNDGEVGYPPF